MPFYVSYKQVNKQVIFLITDNIESGWNDFYKTPILNQARRNDLARFQILENSF